MVRKLNGGGNGDVYQATHKLYGLVALKVLRNQSTRSEPYKRFRQEAVKHSELSQRSFRGILPLLDFDVPEHPDDNHPAWLAMPIAISITEALGEAPEVFEVWQGSTEVALLGSEMLDSGVERLRNELAAKIPAALGQFLRSIRPDQ